MSGQWWGMRGTEPTDPARRARFAEVFALVYEPVQRYVRRRGGGSDSDDIVAEALTVLWRRLDDVPADAEVPWALGIARRCLANHRRSVTRRNSLVERLVTSPVDEPSTDHVLDEALAVLDPDQRELLRLWAWEGLAPREIAVVLGITANAASIRLHRARRELAEVLGPRKTTAPSGHRGARTTQEHR